MDYSSGANNYEVRSKASGPHWIAWLAQPGDEKPVGSVVLVGETREEAEQRAHAWKAQLASGAVVPFP